ncbi:MAG TPA: hypothetical protein VF627_04360 [Abditibacterium sp.]
MTARLSAQKAPQGLDVCPNPSQPCRSADKLFAPYELSFRLPTRLKPNTAYRSVPFYAVVVDRRRSASTDCDAGEFTTSVERERKKAQALFPTRKAFSSPQCPDMSALSYLIDGKNNTQVFTAIYAGKTRREAQNVLGKAKNHFPDAKVHRMQAAFEVIWQ